MELILFGVNLLALMVIWRYVIRKTILDHCRDKLFDIRDDLRSTFVANGWDMGSPVYRQLRDLTNGYLRFTEDFSVWEFLFLDAITSDNAHVRRVARERFQNRFSNASPDQLQYIRVFRRRALRAVMEYAVYSSGLLLVLSFAMVPFMLVAKIVGMVKMGFGVATGVMVKSARHFGETASGFVAASAAVIATQLLNAEHVEKYSYLRGSGGTALA